MTRDHAKQPRRWSLRFVIARLIGKACVERANHNEVLRHHANRHNVRCDPTFAPDTHELSLRRVWRGLQTGMKTQEGCK